MYLDHYPHKSLNLNSPISVSHHRPLLSLDDLLDRPFTREEPALFLSLAEPTFSVRE